MLIVRRDYTAVWRLLHCELFCHQWNRSIYRLQQLKFTLVKSHLIRRSLYIFEGVQTLQRNLLRMKLWLTFVTSALKVLSDCGMSTNQRDQDSNKITLFPELSKSSAMRVTVQSTIILQSLMLIWAGAVTGVRVTYSWNDPIHLRVVSLLSRFPAKMMFRSLLKAYITSPSQWSSAGSSEGSKVGVSAAEWEVDSAPFSREISIEVNRACLNDLGCFSRGQTPPRG